MKKIYLLTALLFSLNSTITHSQTTLTTATDFTVTDIQGNTHNLFSILNSGKYVCIDFFFTTCPPCQYTVPFFKQSFLDYGCNTQDIYFISIDYGDFDSEVVTYENTYIGGNAGFPVISGVEGGGTSVCNAYDITAYPTYILIAPNKQILEQDMYPISNASDFDTYFTSHTLAKKACLTGIKEENNNNTLSVFPNPAVNNLTIETNNNEKINSVRIYNYLGEMVMSESVNNLLKHSIIIEKLKQGMYVLEITTENKAVVIKMFTKQ